MHLRRSVTVSARSYTMASQVTATYVKSFTVFSGAQDPSNPNRDARLPAWEDMQQMLARMRIKLQSGVVPVTADHEDSRVVGRIVDVYLCDSTRSMNVLIEFPGITEAEKLGLELVRQGVYQAVSAEWWPNSPALGGFELRNVTITNLPRSSDAHAHGIQLKASIDHTDETPVDAEAEQNNLTTTAAEHKAMPASGLDNIYPLANMTEAEPASTVTSTETAAPDAPAQSEAVPALDSGATAMEIDAGTDAVSATPPVAPVPPGAEQVATPLSTGADDSSNVGDTAELDPPADAGAVQDAAMIDDAPPVSAPGLSGLLDQIPAPDKDVTAMTPEQMPVGQSVHVPDSAPMDVASEVASVSAPATLREAHVVVAEDAHPLTDVRAGDVLGHEVASTLAPEDIAKLSVIRTDHLDALAKHSAEQKNANMSLAAEIAALKQERDSAQKMVQDAEASMRPRVAAQQVRLIAARRDNMWKRAQGRMPVSAQAVCASLLERIDTSGSLTQSDLDSCDMVLAAIDAATAEEAAAQEKELAITRAELASLKQQRQQAAVSSIIDKRVDLLSRQHASLKVLNPDGTLAVQTDPVQIKQTIMSGTPLPSQATQAAAPTMASLESQSLMDMFAQFLAARAEQKASVPVTGEPALIHAAIPTPAEPTALVSTYLSPNGGLEKASFACDSALDQRAMQDFKQYGTLQVAPSDCYRTFEAGNRTVQYASLAPGAPPPYHNGFTDNADKYMYGFATALPGTPGSTLETASIDVLFENDFSRLAGAPAPAQYGAAADDGSSSAKEFLGLIRAHSERTPEGRAAGQEVAIAVPFMAAWAQGQKIQHGSKAADLPAIYARMIQNVSKMPSNVIPYVHVK